MFVYCLNNPIIRSDSEGEFSSFGEALHPIFPVLPFLNGPLPVGDFAAIAALFLGAILAPSKIEVSADSIDWEGGDKNHILKGTKNKHVPGWKRFGIDPNNNNNHNWSLLLPILHEVVDDADYYEEILLSSGSRIIQYFKVYAEQGVEVMVKIWVSADGVIQQISDAIPYIIE